MNCTLKTSDINMIQKNNPYSASESSLVDNYGGTREVEKTRQKVNAEIYFIVTLLSRWKHLSERKMFLGNKKVVLRQFQKPFSSETPFPRD